MRISKTKVCALRYMKLSRTHVTWSSFLHSVRLSGWAVLLPFAWNVFTESHCMSFSVSNWTCLKAGSLFYITYRILDLQTKSDDLVKFIIKLSEKRDLLSLIWAIVIYLISLFNSVLRGFLKLHHSHNLWVISHINEFIDPTRISFIFVFCKQILSKWLVYNRIQISDQIGETLN